MLKIGLALTGIGLFIAIGISMIQHYFNMKGYVIISSYEIHSQWIGIVMMTIGAGFVIKWYYSLPIEETLLYIEPHN